MRTDFRCLALLFTIALGPSEAADTNTLRIGGMELKSWHVEKWFASCNTDKIENKSSCSAVLNAFDLPEPENVDLNFFLIANRIDLHTSVIHGNCISYAVIDPPHLRMNPATEIRWRAKNMNAPNAIKSFKDVAGARLFVDDQNLLLQKAIEVENVLYVKTVGSNKEVSFSVSTKGYKRVCQAIIAKERELNSGRQ